MLEEYKRMYLRLFHAVTDAERLCVQAADRLRMAQRECEELYLQANETEESQELE